MGAKLAGPAGPLGWPGWLGCLGRRAGLAGRAGWAGQAGRPAQPGWLARLFGRKVESIRLADSRLRYGLPHYSAHHALTDAVATAELLQAQVLTHYQPETPLRDLWY